MRGSIKISLLKQTEKAQFNHNDRLDEGIAARPTTPRTNVSLLIPAFLRPPRPKSLGPAARQSTRELQPPDRFVERFADRSRRHAQLFQALAGVEVHDPSR